MVEPEVRGISGVTIDFAERTVKGFSKEAIPPLVQLAKSLHNNRGLRVQGRG